MIALEHVKIKNQKRYILAAMTCCLSCIFLDTSLIPIALPSIQKEFGFSGLFMQWILNMFYISTAGFVIFAGKLSDIHGQKKIFCSGMILYLIGALLAGCSYFSILILFARSVQGIGAALMMPSAMAIILNEFSAQNLGKAFGFSAGISSVFLTLGPFLGGIATEFFSWRYCFFLPIPLCVLSLGLTIKYVPKGEKNYSKLDFKGLFLLICGLGTLMFALMQAKHWGWFSPKLLNYTLVSSLVLFVLYYHSRMVDFPLLDFSLFKINSFTLGLILGFICQFTATYTVFISILFQNALYLSPVESASYIVVANLPILFCAPAAGILLDKKGARFPVMLGFLLLLFSMGMLILYTLLRKQFILFLGLATFGSSHSLIMTPLSYVALRQIPFHQKGLAAGVYNTIRYLGSAFGIVCIGMVGYVFRISSLKSMLKEHSFPSWIEPNKVDEILKMHGCITDQIFDLLKLINTKSFMISMNAMSAFISLFVILGLILTFLNLYDYKKA